MSSSRTGKTELKISILLALILLGGAACDDEEDTELTLGFNSSPPRSGTPGTGMNDNNDDDGTNNATENNAASRDRLGENDVVYIEGAAGVSSFRALDLRAQTDYFMFDLAALTGEGLPAIGDVATGDFTVSPDRARVVFVPTAATNLLVAAGVDGTAPFVVVPAELSPGTIRTPRSLPDGDVLFTAGRTGASGTYIESRLYRVDLLSGRAPEPIDVNLSTCAVIRDVATHTSDGTIAWGIRDACADPAEAGLVFINLRLGVTELFLGRVDEDPGAFLALPAASDDGDLFLIGNGSFDSNADLFPDVEGIGVFEVNGTNGELVGVNGPDNPDSRVDSVAPVGGGDTLIFEISRNGQRNLWLASLSTFGAITRSNTARSPVAVR